MKEATIEPMEREQDKTPSTRLLDLVAGWGRYVSTDEDNGLCDPALSGEELAALYQEVGGVTADWDDAGLSIEAERERVRAFVEERLLPLLLR